MSGKRMKFLRRVAGAHALGLAEHEHPNADRDRQRMIAGATAGFVYDRLKKDWASTPRNRRRALARSLQRDIAAARRGNDATQDEAEA